MPQGHPALDVLEGLRIGCVRYLNARPLIEPYPGPVILEHPAVLAAGLIRGDLDVALVPVFEALRHPEFPIVDGVCISSLGPVWSVYVAYQGRLEEVREITLDPASLTSVNLCKVLFAEWGASKPAFVPEPAAEGSARLLIGNQAIEFRERHGADFHYLDLGEEWTLRTGLPFVYAVWLLRPAISGAETVAGAFRELAQIGKAQVREIAASHPEYGVEFALRYLTEHIRFDLGCAEKQGLAKFRELLCKHELLPAAEQPLQFL